MAPASGTRPALRERGWPLLLAAGVFPLLLGLALTFLESRRDVQRELDATSRILLRHAQTISDHAWRTVNTLKRLEHNDSTCEDLEPDLQRIGSIRAYFRSIGLTHGHMVFCSSAFGPMREPLADVIQREIPGLGRWSMSVEGTTAVRERPAVVFADLYGDVGAYTIVDGQYLTDFMRAIGEPRGYYMSVVIGDGHPVTQGEPPTDTHPLFSPLSDDTSSPQIMVRVSAPESESVHAWWRIFTAFLPLAAILSALCMMAAAYWLRRKMSYRDEIRRGIARREFSVQYQPVYDIQAGCCGGVEALLRWQRADGRWERPDVFIAAAEAEHMIIPLTRHLFELVAADMAEWQAPRGFHVAVNVAAEHLQDPTFVADVRRFAAQIATHGPRITLELTERSLISDRKEVVTALHTLRAEGVDIALDDFGTGHCAMSYLQTFPLDFLKIDRGFVNAIESLDGDAPVLDAIIALSKRLALRTVAEGVETAVQLAYLKRQGVLYVQGYLYARPMSSDALARWLPTRGCEPLPSTDQIV